MVISYEVVETLGEGSFGVVTKNKAPTCRSYYNQHKFVAIKRIKDANDPEAQNEVNVLNMETSSSTLNISKMSTRKISASSWNSATKEH